MRFEIKNKSTAIAVDVLCFVLGCSLYAMSVNVFTEPFDIAPGGVTGIAIILKKLIGVPLGITSIVLNIPLFILAAKILGTKFLTKTITATLLLSVLLDVFAFLPSYRGDAVIAAVFGGVFNGIGLSLIFLRGGTTGGSDIASRLIKKLLPYVSMGRILLVIDAVVIVASAIVFKSIESALYAIIVIFASSTVVDKALYGASMGKAVYIFSKDKSADITAAVTQELHRGVTVITGRGGYTGDNREMLFCILKKAEVARVRKIVLNNDPDAFVVIGEVGEVLGEGFADLKETN